MKMKSFFRIAQLDKVAIASILLGASVRISGCASTGHHEDRGALAGAAAGAPAVHSERQRLRYLVQATLFVLPLRRPNGVSRLP